MKNKHESFTQIMNQLAHRHGVQALFSDFLHLCICAFSHGAKEDEYLSTIRKYEKPEAYRISEALGALVVEMTGDGTGLVDVLGAYFEEYISHGHNGQFFTPQPICDLLAAINQPIAPQGRILDPACGSGRMLLSAAKFNRFARFYGADNDRNCARMTAINLFLNNLYGEVAWMDSISNRFYGGWAIEPTIKGVPRIREIAERESRIHLKLPEIVLPLPEITPQPQNPDAQQQLLFEF